MQARSVFLIKTGTPEQAFELRTQDLKPLAPNEVLIKVRYSGLNFADVMARKGRYDDAPEMPCVLGYDVSGVVERVGNEVSNVRIGDRVMALTRFGGYSDYVISPLAGLALIPEGVSDETAVALATQGATAYHCAIQSTTLYEGDKVLIHAAAGGVGSLLVQLARHAGCYVIGTASTSKQEHLKEMGVDLAIDYTEVNFKEKIESVIGKNQLDVAFDSIGGDNFDKSINLLGPGGRMIFYGAASMLGNGSASVIDLLKTAWGFGFKSPINLIQESKALIGINMLRIADHKPQILQAALQGVLDLAQAGVIIPHIGGIYPYTHMAKAHRFLESRQSIGKIIIDWKAN